MAETFESNGRFFIKSFLLDDTLNLNKWSVTKDAILNNLNSFIGKPFVITPTHGHPEADTGDDLLVEQEKFRVGNIIEVGYETDTGRAFAISEITSQSAIETLKAGDPMFVSPSIVFGDSDVMSTSGNTIVQNFEGAHLAAVDEPAYGIQKAQIKGKCNGSAVDCKSQLAKVQAESDQPVTYAGFPTLRECVDANLSEDDPVGYCMMKRELVNAEITNSKCGNYTKIDTGKSVFIIANNDCVGNCLSKKGKPITDQDIAICLSECGESKEGVMDPQSVQNITTPCTLSLEDKKVKCSSNNIKTDHNKSMSNAQNNDDDKRKEEEEAKKAQEEEEKDEEAKKAQEEDKEEDDKVKQMEKEMDEIKEELKSLKSKVRNSALEPLAASVLEAQKQLRIVKEAEAEDQMHQLMKYDEETLTSLKAQYDKLIEQANTPKYTVKYASVNSDTSDKVFLDKVMKERY